jgi:protein-tyrosine phosphatase
MASLSASELPPPRELGAPYRVCLVCLGNICRSPMAEAVLRASLVKAGLDGVVVVDSAGTGDWHVGGPMDPGARSALARRGYDGSAHRARQFQPSWLAQRDLVLAMDAHNLANLRRMAGAWGKWTPGAQDAGIPDAGRIRLFGEVGGLTETAGGDIPDPWGGNADEFGYVLDLLRAAAPVIAGRLARTLEPSDPSVSDPGLSEPSLSEPSLSDPGLSDPGLSDPGLSDPGLSDPGLSDPSLSDPSALA